MRSGAYEFAQVGAVQVLEDVKEAVDEEGVVLDELVVLGDLPGGQQPQLRVDRLVPLRHRGGAANPNGSKFPPPGGTDDFLPPASPQRAWEVESGGGRGRGSSERGGGGGGDWGVCAAEAMG